MDAVADGASMSKEAGNWFSKSGEIACVSCLHDLSIASILGEHVTFLRDKHTHLWLPLTHGQHGQVLFDKVGLSKHIDMEKAGLLLSQNFKKTHSSFVCLADSGGLGGDFQSVQDMYQEQAEKRHQEDQAKLQERIANSSNLECTLYKFTSPGAKYHTTPDIADKYKVEVH